MQYEILSNTSAELLSGDVKEKLDAHWAPLGQPFVSIRYTLDMKGADRPCTYFHQAVILRD